MDLNFKKISTPPSEAQIYFLYKLLQSRDCSISHLQCPSFEEHSEFVINHPYRFWYIIFLKTSPIGSLYFAFDNSVGLHTLPSYSYSLQSILKLLPSMFDPLPGIKSVRSKYFFFNVAPENNSLRDALLDVGYSISQISYTMPLD